MINLIGESLVNDYRDKVRVFEYSQLLDGAFEIVVTTSVGIAFTIAAELEESGRDITVVVDWN